MKIHRLLRLAATACLSTIVYNSSIAQSSTVIPPSPDAMATINSIQTPVNHNTGLPNVQVPLFSVQSGNIQVPIALAYHSTGRKVNESCGSYGLGWRLVGGGKITRVVKSVPDDALERIYGNGAGTVAKKFYTDAPEDPPYHHRQNSEPDVFFFEIPGKSGMFVFDHLGNAHTIPYQNISIKWVPTELGKINGQSYFIIKDETGTEYIFGHNPLSYEQTFIDQKTEFNPYDGATKTGTYSTNYISTWHLDEIKSYGEGNVKFDYGAATPIFDTLTDWTYKFPNEFKSRIDLTTSTTTLKMYPRDLRYITWEGGKIEFTSSTIKIYSSIEALPVKLFQLNYSSHAASASPGGKKPFKLLTKVSESYDNGITLCMLAQFSYYSLPAPQITANSAMDYDSWGYYNGKKNTTYRSAFSNNPGADRTPSLEHTKHNVLESVYYPTSGRTVFDYELNEYFDPKDPYDKNNTTAGGLRIKEVKIIGSGKTQKTTKYKYITAATEFDQSKISSGKIKAAPRVGFMFTETGNITGYYISSKSYNDFFDINGQNIIYSSVIETVDNGSRMIYEYIDYQKYINGGLNNRKGADSIYMDLPSRIHAISLKGATPGEDPALSHDNSIFGDDFVVYPNTSRFWRRGLLKSVSAYDANNKLVSKSENTYTFGPVKAIVNGFIPGGLIPGYYLNKYIPEHHDICRYQWISEPVTLTKTTVAATSYNPASETTYTYDTQYMVPIKIEAKDCEGNITKTVFKYSFNYSAYPLISLNNLKIVAPVEQTVYRKLNVSGSEFKIIGSEYTEYGSFNGKILPSKTYSLLTAQALLLTDFKESYVSGTAIIKDTKYKLNSIIDSYDNLGRPLTTSSPTGQKSTTVYGHGNSVPIASVSHAHQSAPVYTTKENYLWIQFKGEGGSGDFTNTFNIAFEQEIRIQISIPGYPNYPVPPKEYVLKVFDYYNSGTPVAQHLGKDNEFPPAFTLPKGDYYIVFYYQTPPSFSYTEMSFGFTTRTMERYYTRQNQVFHTSFEDIEGSTASANAKTGSKVYSNKVYSIDLRDFAPGSYDLTYWKSTNSGSTWVKVSETLTVTTSSTGKDIGGASTMVDEVRLIPVSARIKTYTYRPGVGLSSETDHNGVSTFYEYDSRGRLYRVRDNEKRLMKQYEYNMTSM